MTTGSVRFCRYAYPPSALGYCGPADADPVLEHGAGRPGGPQPAQLARSFHGAWPTLCTIAAASGLDPLDEEVVEAYWVGNDLLDGVDPLPHHNTHVLLVYPWLGLLRRVPSPEPLRVLDRCRIRWGTVEHAGPDRLAVRSRPLVFDGIALAVGEPRVETAVAAAGGRAFVTDLRPGDRVALHWDWVCERLDRRGVDALRRNTARALTAANALLRTTAGAPALG